MKNFGDSKTEELLASVSSSAAVFRAVFIAYLIFAGYAGAIILSVTDRDLFLDADLTAPVLNVKFKTSYFFIVVPCIFLLLHLNLLTHMSVLVKKLNAYRENINSDSVMLGLLPDVLLIQSADKKHSSGFKKYFLKGVFTYGALMVLPVFILCFIWAKFLAFQSTTITLFHFMVIIADIVLIGYFSPDMEKIDTSQKNKNLNIKLGIIVVFIIGGMSAYSKYVEGIAELDVSGQRLYLDLGSYVSPAEACKEENKTLGAVLKNRSYKGANLVGAILCHVNLMGSQLQGANLDGAELQSANLGGAELQGANLGGAELQGADLVSVQLQGANLREAQLQGANLREAQLQGADLGGAELQGANLRGAQLQGANLRVAYLQSANLGRADLQGANLGGAYLQGADLWRAGLQGAGLGRAELQGAFLGGAYLQGAFLGGAELQGANLDGAQLQGAYSEGEVLGYIPRSFARFNDVITLRVSVQGDLSGISNVTITNMTAYIQAITTMMGGFVSKVMIGFFTDRMEESKEKPSADISQAITGSYTKEDARQWIEKNKEAMCKIPKDIYEARYRKKLDCP